MSNALIGGCYFRVDDRQSRVQAMHNRGNESTGKPFADGLVCKPVPSLPVLHLARFTDIQEPRCYFRPLCRGFPFCALKPGSNILCNTGPGTDMISSLPIPFIVSIGQETFQNIIGHVFPALLPCT